MSLTGHISRDLSEFSEFGRTKTFRNISQNDRFFFSGRIFYINQQEHLFSNIKKIPPKKNSSGSFYAGVQYSTTTACSFMNIVHRMCVLIPDPIAELISKFKGTASFN